MEPATKTNFYVRRIKDPIQRKVQYWKGKIRTAWVGKKVNPPGTPKDQIRCEYCRVLLTDKIRSKISKCLVCLKLLVYQNCKACRKRYLGRVDDGTLLKWAYKREQKKGKKK